MVEGALPAQEGPHHQRRLWQPPRRQRRLLQRRLWQLPRRRQPQHFPRWERLPQVQRALRVRLLRVQREPPVLALPVQCHPRQARFLWMICTQWPQAIRC